MFGKIWNARLWRALPPPPYYSTVYHICHNLTHLLNPSNIKSHNTWIPFGCRDSVASGRSLRAAALTEREKGPGLVTKMMHSSAINSRGIPRQSAKPQPQNRKTVKPRPPLPHFSSKTPSLNHLLSLVARCHLCIIPLSAQSLQAFVVVNFHSERGK